jgi:geranylgeranyl pyrophosphate synthase
MDIHQSVVECLLAIPMFESWSELGELLKRVASRKPRAWWLPVRACQAVGGTFGQAVPASAAFACMQISISLLDDMLDKDPRGEHHRLGEAQAANMASAFQALGAEALVASKSPQRAKLAMLYRINHMALSTAFGQYLDIQNPQDEEAYWRLVENKSGLYFEAAFSLGVLAGGATDEVVEKIKQFGQLYGQMIQIHDDINDAMAIPANPDWTQKRSSLPILFACLVDHPARSRFLQLYQEVSEPETLKEAQDILIRCGAVSYCVDQLLQRQRAAQELLESFPLKRRASLDELLEEMVAPVHKLFQALEQSPA